MKTCTRCHEHKPLTEFVKRANRKSGFQSQCRACANASNAKYRADNPKQASASNAKYRAANHNKVKEINAKYKSDNPEVFRIKSHNRRARQREAGGKLSIGLAERLFKLQRGKCACCGEPLGTDYHLDHIMPLALGGSNTDNNIQLLRSVCNLNKRSKHPIDFMQQRGFLL